MAKSKKPESTPQDVPSIPAPSVRDQKTPHSGAPQDAPKLHRPDGGTASGYYIVNPQGTIHECDRAHAKERLREVGWRMATPEEIQALHDAGGNQRFDRPLATPWSPEPEPEAEIE